MALHRIDSKNGLQVAPNQEADMLIFGHLFKIAMPAGFMDDALWVADKVADHGFQAGWFYDDLPDDKIDELVDYAQEEAGVHIPRAPFYNDFFKNIAQRAILTGSHAFTMAQLDNIRVRG